MTKRTRTALAAVLAVALSVGLTACDDVNTAKRPDDPVVLTGAQLAALLGLDPDDIVAFRHTRPGGVPTWTQIPVQVDERKVVDFGSQPATNAEAGVTGTVYGTAPIGVTHLQYADPDTFVGADSDPAFDADDELVFMAADGGGTPRPTETREPAGVVPGSGVRVRFEDPAVDGGQGWVFLFERAGSLDPAAGADYVDYDFALTSGDYKTTYKRADGPNPETSTATTATHRIGFTDRWIEDLWQVDTGAGWGPDVLDGMKDRFALSTCGRSNATFQDAEGAFVANIDGPVRAIRSYVGANSGPLTQRTHKLYRTFEETVTDLRVHAIPGIMSFVDLAAVPGMTATYYSSTTPGGVPVDGSTDTVSTDVATWELLVSSEGSVATAYGFESSLVPSGDPAEIASWFYRDELSSSVDQCWGDDHFIGASGPHIDSGIANTDPRTSPFATLQSTRFSRFDAGALTPTEAAQWADHVAEPLVTTVDAYPAP